jgi:hypothetical protein
MTKNAKATAADTNALAVDVDILCRQPSNDRLSGCESDRLVGCRHVSGFPLHLSSHILSFSSFIHTLSTATHNRSKRSARPDIATIPGDFCLRLDETLAKALRKLQPVANGFSFRGAKWLKSASG